jgi:RNA polymerase sigma-70 factor, ECF subfamily
MRKLLERLGPPRLQHPGIMSGTMPGHGELTELLGSIASANLQDQERLMALLYSELRRMAAARLRLERPHHTLTPTALVHEAYLRLFARADQSIQGRSQFFGFAARVMRQVLVDHARARNAAKRAGAQAVNLGDALDLSAPEADAQIVALDEALDRLAHMSPRQCRVVELRYFGGLTEEQVAESLNVTRRTVNRDWKIARTWLFAEISKSTKR